MLQGPNFGYRGRRFLHKRIYFCEIEIVSIGQGPTLSPRITIIINTIDENGKFAKNFGFQRPIFYP